MLPRANPRPVERLRDKHHRLLPGVVPGWGMSWWWHEQGITHADTVAMTSEQCLNTMLRYWRAVAAGWWPDVPRSAWVGPHHPFKNDNSAR